MAGGAAGTPGRHLPTLGAVRRQAGHRCRLARQVPSGMRATLSRCPAGGEGSWTATPEQELDDVAARFATALAAAGIGVRRCGGGDLYEWMFRWFNPHPPIEHGDADAVLKATPYPGDDGEGRPFGYDFSEALMLGMPVADPDAGLWWFDDIPHRLVSVQSLAKAPLIGQLALERLIGDHRFAVLDRMPEHDGDDHRHPATRFSAQPPDPGRTRQLRRLRRVRLGRRGRQGCADGAPQGTSCSR